MGPGLVPGAGHKVKALKPCWTVMFIFFLVARRFPEMVSIPEQQVSNRLGLLTNAGTALGSLPHTRLRSSRGGGSSHRRVGSTRDGSPRPHLADFQGFTVSTGRPRRKTRSRRGVALGARRREPLPQTRGAPPCRQRWVQGGRGPTAFVGETGG